MALFQDVEIITREIGSSVLSTHRHNYFELLFILDGNGIHTINNNNYHYESGNLYLLTPEDTHTFQIETATRCCIIDFTRELFARSHKKAERPDISEFFGRMEYVFHNHQNIKGHIAMGADDALLTERLILKMIGEKNGSGIYKDVIIQNIVFLLLNMIARLIQETNSGEMIHSRSKNMIHEVTTYIQQHIYNKENLKLENIGKVFHKTADHLNRSFKSHTGYSLKAFINKYKLNLVETRLRYSDLTISEIAHEMGFTDESHLNKVFKSEYGKTASAYRKSELY